MQYLVEHDLGVAYGNDYDLIHYICIRKLWESLPGAAGNVVHFGVLRYSGGENGTCCRPRVGRDIHQLSPCCLLLLQICRPCSPPTPPSCTCGCISSFPAGLSRSHERIASVCEKIVPPCYIVLRKNISCIILPAIPFCVAAVQDALVVVRHDQVTSTLSVSWGRERNGLESIYVKGSLAI